MKPLNNWQADSRYPAQPDTQIISVTSCIEYLIRYPGPFCHSCQVISSV